MTPEEVARAYQFREGFTLVDYSDVGLPVFRLTIEAITTAYRTLPTIHEFTMRCLALGETREESIASMLGLKPDVICGAMNILVSEGYVARQAAPSDLQSFRLTEAGQARLEKERLETPQEETLVIDYDGIRRATVRLAGTNVLRASELRSIGAIEIRPYPAEPPTIRELAIPDVTRAIRRQTGEDFRRTVLALKNIVRRNNVYREAVALVYAADHGDEVQVAIAIDGKLSESHERAFAEHGGPRKMGFVKSLKESDTRRRLDRIVGRDIMRACPARAELASLRATEAEAEATIRSVRPAAETGGSETPAKIMLSAAKGRLLVARHTLTSMAVRPLACFEQGELLQEGIEQARRSLIITSAGLQPAIVNGFVLRQLDQLLESGVSVQVQTPLSPQLEARGGIHYDPLVELSKRGVQGRSLLTKGHRRELYFLIQDDELAVISNRPFFGDGTRRSGFIRVSGIVARRPEYVRAIREVVLSNPRGERSLA